MSKRLVRLGIIILLVVLVIGAGLYFGLNSILNWIPRIDPEETFSGENESISASSPIASEEYSASESATEAADTVPSDSNIVTILLVGHNGEGAQTRGTSNAMILCTLDKRVKKLTLTSFHSDLQVTVPNHGTQKLSAAGKLGGTKLLGETLKYNFGILPDHTIMIDFASFPEAIDEIGGVEITLLEGEAICLNEYAKKECFINELWYLKAGKNTLTGTQTLAYSRMEESGTDFGRTDRQRVILSAMLAKLKNMDIDTGAKQVKKLLQMVATDMTNDQIIALLADLIPMFSQLETVSQNVPQKGTYTVDKGKNGTVLIMNKEQLEHNRTLLESLYGK